MPLTPRPTILTGGFTTDRIDVGETWTFEGRIETPVHLTSVGLGVLSRRPPPSFPISTLRVVGATLTVSNVNLTVPGVTVQTTANPVVGEGYTFYRLVRMMNPGDSFDFVLTKEYEEGDHIYGTPETCLSVEAKFDY